MAVDQYAQDNDEVFPPMQNAQEFQAALLPFVGGDPVAFRCPDTGLPYTPNAALSRKSYPTDDSDTIEVVRDSEPHADGLNTVVFLDGHVEHGGVEVGDPVMILVDRAEALSIAVSQYMQDNDETFPPMQTPQAFQAAVYPYAHSRRIFNAPNGLPFVPNPALSGVGFASIADPSGTVLFHDSAPYPDGLPTVVYLDSRLERGGVEYGDPNTIVVSRAKRLSIAVTLYVQDNDETFPPMHSVQEFQAALFPYLKTSRYFTNTNGQPFVPNAALSDVNVASVADPASTVLFQDTAPYTGGAPTIAYADGHVTHTTASYTHVLWINPDGRAVLWNSNADGTYSDHGQYGPYTDGGGTWKAVSLATGPSGVSRLLWTNPDGRMVLWYIAPDGTHGDGGQFGPYTDAGGTWRATAVSVGSDNLPHILWTNPDGREVLWNAKSDGTYGDLGQYGPYTDAGGTWKATAVSVGPDNLSHILWNSPDGRSVLWDGHADGTYSDHGQYGPYTDSGGIWRAVTVSVGPDALPHLLWTNPDGREVLWDGHADGTYTDHGQYGPYTDGGGTWQAAAVSIGPDALAHLLWTNPDGRAVLWDGKPDGTYGDHGQYGPYTDGGGTWRATAVSTGP